MFFAYSLIISCSLMHIFCCGIPLLITVIGLGTNLGFAIGEFVNSPLLEKFERFEVEILLLSGAILALAFFIKFKARILNCCQTMAKDFCKKEEKINSLLLNISSVLYITNLLAFFVKHVI